jgi:hypothetical protein
MQTTVKTTLSEFWRTHQDNWQQFKSQFTEEQVWKTGNRRGHA